MREKSMAKRVQRAADLFLAGRFDDAMRVTTTGRKVDVAAITASVAVCLAAVDASRPTEKGPTRAMHFAAELMRRACFTDELDDTIARQRNIRILEHGYEAYAVEEGHYDTGGDR